VDRAAPARRLGSCSGLGRVLHAACALVRGSAAGCRRLGIAPLLGLLLLAHPVAAAPFASLWLDAGEIR
jgi:hypothetical protein